MKDKTVKEIMIPLSDYATVSEDATLEDAVKVLHQSQKETKYKYKHRAVLAYGKSGNITGKLSIFDIFKALEPKYRHFEHPGTAGHIGLTRFGLSHDFLNSLIENYSLWDETLEALVKKAAKLKVKDIMYSPSDDEYVDENAPVAEGIHRAILGCHQSILVLRHKQVVGILRVIDIFDLVCDVLEKD